ncbi:MAG: ABC transporter substrate-binding protein [Beijerinckiaceae bacterium]
MRLARTSFLATIAVALSVGLAFPAHAQKAKDTLRIAFKDPIETVDPLVDPKPETSLVADAVYDKLLTYIAAEGVFKPILAASWKQTSPTVIEFVLREGVKFHDGKELTAEDVAYTYSYLIDPKSKLRFFRNWSFVDKAEATGKYTVRFTLKQPTPYALARFATSTPIFPKHVHEKFATRGEFGRKSPIGTGPYKVVYVDASKGIRLVRNDDYKSPGPWYPKATIKTIDILPMPEIQTQIAQMMTGGLDVILEVPKDQTEQMALNPAVNTTAIANTVYYYANLDAAGRSGLEALTKKDVRRALFMAINRKAIASSVVAGGKAVKVIDAPCTELQFGCKASVKPVDFDPKAAKALLAKAGYPSGFDLDITSIPGAHEVAEAIAGQLRVIGVKAKVSRMTMGGYRKKQVSGNLQMLVSHYSSGGLPDVSSVLAFYQAGPRDYWKDPALKKAMQDGASETDQKKRADIYDKAFSRMNEEALVLPISSHPAVLVHSADVTMPSVSTLFAGVEFNNIKWK